MRRTVQIAILATALLVSPAFLAAPCERIVALGDLHGGLEPARTMLRRTGLVDDAENWVGGASCLVQVGDLIDRGPDSRELLDLFRKLQSTAPDRVFVLLGNHEAMNMTGDLRYVTAEEFAAYAGEETEAERQAARERFATLPGQADLAEAELQARFGERFPPGWFGHRRAFAADGQYGAWLLRRPAVVRLEGNIFVHGGLSEADAQVGYETLNDAMRRELETFLDDRGYLETRGWLDPLDEYGDTFRKIDARIGAFQRAAAERAEEEDPLPEPVELTAARRYLAFGVRGLANRDDGPLWNRDWAEEDEASLRPVFDGFEEEHGIRRMVIGHTPTRGFRIRERLDGRLFAIDTGSGPYYEGGTPSALEILADGSTRAVYPETTEPLWPWSDERKERFLAEAEVVSIEELGVGITEPRQVVLRLGDRMHRAVFKDYHVESLGVTELRNRTELNFSDSWRYELAAYELDRLLGLDMVPVAVRRRVGGTEGALIWWLEGTVGAREEYEGNVTPTDAVGWEHQQTVQRLFDALIRNTDRNLSNMLIRTTDFRLLLIDHSRAFRYEIELLGAFANQKIARLPRELHPRLEALELRSLTRLLRSLVPKARVRAMLERRDAILARISRDRRRFGDDAVFW